MPYKSEKCHVQGTEYDKRVKLTEEQKALIVDIRNNEGKSYNELGRMFGVSKSLIILICRPDIKERKRENFKRLQKDGRYYDREKHNECIRNLRIRKQELFKEGKIAIPQHQEEENIN